nr:hypothetical protein [Anaerolineaceae bacterium]
QKAASAGSLEALIELAKYYEHQSREFEKAMRCTDQAISICEDISLNHSLLHRKARLESKILKNYSDQS